MIATRLWGPRWNGCSVNLKTDSKSTVDVWHHGYRFNPHKLKVLNQKLSAEAQQHGFDLALSFIHGDDNPADAISRDKKEIFRQRNPFANPSPTPIPLCIVRDLSLQ